jgi:hypothetical protein
MKKEGESSQKVMSSNYVEEIGVEKIAQWPEGPFPVDVCDIASTVQLYSRPGR